MSSCRFIAGGTLSPVVKRLRMLGIDCDYDGGLAIHSLILIAVQTGRILLSKVPIPNTDKLRTFQITTADPDEQTREIMNYFNLYNIVQPFSRCLICNCTLTTVAKNRETLAFAKRISSEVAASVVRRGLEMFECPQCDRLYWHGDHIKRMRQRLIKEGLLDAGGENAHL